MKSTLKCLQFIVLAFAFGAVQASDSMPKPTEIAENWAKNHPVGSVWPGLEGDDQSGATWQPNANKATLYVFSRSVVW